MAYKPPEEHRRCTAKSKQTQERCKARAIPGGNVCHHHGGGAPQTRQSAAARLLALIDPAITTLADVMNAAEKDADRINAANSILDRAGVPRTQANIEGDAARDMLLDRLRMLRDEAAGK